MSNLWENKLRDILSANKKIAVLCVGNRFRMDDGAGCLLCDKLVETENFKPINAESNPENHIDEITKSEFESLILIDAANFGGKIGEIRFIKEEDISCFTLSTHNIPLSLIVSMIKLDNKNINTYFIGIQIGKCGFGEEVSEEVLKSIEKIRSIFKEFGYA